MKVTYKVVVSVIKQIGLCLVSPLEQGEAGKQNPYIPPRDQDPFARKDMNSDVEIRKLPFSVRLKLSSMLEINDAWKVLMAVIPQENDSERTRKYNAEHVRY